jgi:hypothetical protein
MEGVYGLLDIVDGTRAPLAAHASPEQREALEAQWAN